MKPKFRFSGFLESWSKKNLGDIARFSKGKGISKSDIDPLGKNECIRYGELYTFYGETIDTVISRTNISLEDLVLSEKNDVIIPASGESSVDIAKASCVKREGVALGGDINIIKTRQNGVFLSYCLNGKCKYEIAKLAQGNSVVHLYPSQLSLLEIHLPTIEEQQKIASFLTLVDEKISKLKEKEELLEQYKKGVMHQIFSQELRFKDDTGEDFPEWEEYSLGEIASKVNDKNKSMAVTRVLSNSATQGVVNQQDYFDKDIANQKNLGGYYLVKKDDFVYNPRISSTAPVGPIKRNKIGLGVMSPLYTVFRFSKGEPEFFEHYFETSIWHDHMYNVANSGARHDRMNITNNDLFVSERPPPSIFSGRGSRPLPA